MFGPLHTISILNTAEILVKATHALGGYPAIVEQMNTLEESMPRCDEPPEGEPERTSGTPVSGLRRRWLIARDVFCQGAAEALQQCARAASFAPSLRGRLSKLALAVETLCPMDLVDLCDVCDRREVLAHMAFAGERAVCDGCVRGALHRANATRIPDEPVMTETFLHELLSLHRVPHWELESCETAMARDAMDAAIRRERLMSLGDLGDVQKRWFVAIAPIAVRLETFADIMPAWSEKGKS